MATNVPAHPFSSVGRGEGTPESMTGL